MVENNSNDFRLNCAAFSKMEVIRVSTGRYLSCMFSKVDLIMQKSNWSCMFV